jgi:hypothetical protein
MAALKMNGTNYECRDNVKNSLLLRIVFDILLAFAYLISCVGHCYLTSPWRKINKYNGKLKAPTNTLTK